MIDWTRLGDETVDLCLRYLMIDTTNPPGGEIAGATFLADVLSGDGIPSEIAEAAPGRANLLARVAGDGALGAVVLHHHIDVVYADRRYWTVDPFGGEIRDGFLYGRGAIDMKSTGIVQLAAVLAIKRARVALKRDLVVLATADEETGSRFGAQWLAQERPHWLAGAEYALGELAAIEHRAGWHAPIGWIAISEKTALPIRLTARGEPGHGSMPWADTAPNRLVRALGRLLAAEREPRVLPDVQEGFARLAPALPPDDRAGFGDLERALADDTFRRRFVANPGWAASVRTTFALTMLRGSEKRNVIPPEAVADVDCRLLAGDDPDDVLAWVRRVVDDEHVDVQATAPAKLPNLSAPDTEMYKAIAGAIERRQPGAIPTPAIFPGFTDNWVFRRAGLHAYGWTPFVMSDGELARIHGNDERISLDNLRAGVRSYTELLLAVAAA